MWHCGRLALVALVAALVLPASAGSGAGARRMALGRSYDGRLITAVELGDPASPRKALVVGCIHGNECAGLAVVRRLERLGPTAGVDLWLVPDLNPDGRAAGVRWNARHVDLNRNFPWRWRRLRGIHDSGPAPASERETRLAMRVILRLRPRVTIWFHQQLRLVTASGDRRDRPLERRFARLAGLPLRRLPTYPGTATGWQNFHLPATTAFVVELPAGSLARASTERYAQAVRAVVRAR